MRQSLITAEVVRLTTRTILTLTLLTLPSRALAGAGHDHGSSQFQQGDAGSVQNIKVDAVTAKRLELKIEPATRQQLSFGISTNGQIESLPNKQVDVTTPVGGTVTRLLVNPGDAVTAGQAVAMMTSPELASLRTESLDRQAEAIAAMQQAEADLKLAQQNLEQQRKIVTANIRQAKTEESFAQERYSKDQELLARGAIPRRTMLESEVNLQEAKAALAKAESALEVSEAQAQLYRAQSAVSVAQKRVKLSSQTYQTRLQQLGATPNSDGAIIIKAPISGIVANRETTLGESGQDAGKRIMTIVNNNDVQVSANIFEKDIDQVQIGQRVRVRANGLPDQTFEGRVNVIGAVVNGDTRIVPVKATLKNGNGVLKPGMFVELEVLTDRTSTGVLAIPKSALIETNDRQQVVFVQNGDSFQAIDVELGRESGEFVEVKKGIFDGDLIVIQRANQLYAQSLRGGNTAADNHSEGEDASEGEDTNEIASSTAWLPWWLIVPVGGIIMGGAFWAGSSWSSRRSRQTLANDSLSNNVGYETEIYLDHAKPMVEPQLEEPLTNPRQSD